MMVVNKTTDTKISNFHSKTDYPVEKEDHLCGTSFSEGGSFLDSYQNQNDWVLIFVRCTLQALQYGSKLILIGWD